MTYIYQIANDVDRQDNTNKNKEINRNKSQCHNKKVPVDGKETTKPTYVQVYRLPEKHGGGLYKALAIKNQK